MDGWLVFFGLLAAIGATLLYRDCFPDKTYDARFGIEIIDRNGWNTGNSGQPLTVNCGTCGWSNTVVFGDRHDGVAEAAAEQHKLEHEQTMNMIKSARKVGVTNS